MRRVLQYIIREVKEGRLSKSGAIELTKELRLQDVPANSFVMHPLLHRNTSDLSVLRFSTRLSGEEFYLHGDVVDGSRVMSDGAHLEMARAAVEMVAGVAAKTGVHLDDVTWLRPVVVGESGLELHVELFPEEDGRISYEIFSGATQGERESQLLHSLGCAVLGPIAPVADLDVVALQAVCRDRIVSDHVASLGAARGLSVGPDRAGRTQGLLRLQLPIAVDARSDIYALHPSTMDAVLQASAGLSVSSDGVLDRLIPPFAVEEIQVISPSPAGGFAWIRSRHDAGKLDIDVCDDAGRVCVRLRGLGSQAVAEDAVEEAAATLLAKRVWQTGEALQAAAPSHRQHWVVLCGEATWTRAIEAELKTVLPQSRCVVFGGGGGIAQRYQAAVLQIVQLLQQIVRERPEDDVLIQAVIGVAEEDALFVGLSGLLKTARLEHSKLKGQVISCEGKRSAAEIVGDLQNSAQAPDENEVLYLNGERKVQSWIELPSGSVQQVPWRDSGVYLITGGLGGLGLIFAEEIARRAKDTIIVLTGRSELDDSKRLRLSLIEAIGARVEYRRVDIADAAAVRAMVGELRTAYGSISGIVHAAGVIRDGFLLKKTPEDVSAVLAPKVAGVVNLDEATADLTLEFMVLFGSGAGAFGNVGQADYAAGNAFLDCYAAHRNALVSRGERWGRTMSIAWPLWHEGGMQVPEATARQQRKAGLTPLATADGLQSFYQALAADQSDLIVLSGRQPQLSVMLRRAPAVEAAQPEQKRIEAAAPARASDLLPSVQAVLLEAVSELVGVNVDELDLGRELSEYGFDSIGFMTLAHQLNETYGLDLMPTIFFEYPTLDGFSSYLVDHYKEIFAARYGYVAKQVAVETADVAEPVGAADLLPPVQTALLLAVSDLVGMNVDEIDLHRELSEYGFDSIGFMTLAHQLNETYGLELMPTIFFEHPTLGGFSRHLVDHHAVALGARFAPALKPSVQSVIQATKPAEVAEVAEGRPRRLRRPARFVVKQVTEPKTVDAVAVIGMSGRFPMAEDVAGFWRNLMEERDCIVEIPQERWDWRALYGDPLKEVNKTNAKWGGFIDGVGEFDPLFFNISPREAALMDPQQRLLMIYVWKAIEDAGYSAASLSGSSTAILVGTGASGYSRIIGRSRSAIDGFIATGMTPSVGPNRMSYFLNLHGPSEPIETACSSSLVAVHRAMLALANDSCEMAIAGGVNTVLTPAENISLNKAGMLSVDGRCKAFSRHANGYVRAEGVGMVVLKKLSAAERDGDHIYGVIRGSAENHGGRAQSLTAPNPKAQADLIKMAYTRAGIDPRTVSYIEAHGTGTALGDPIEINGLKGAFQDLLQQANGDAAASRAYCGLGTAKSNIGHLELAAGIAGLIKVLLQLKHKTLVKSLHCEELNPYIQLEDSPFYIVRETQPWRPLQDAQGNDLPRRASVSSFGFGGVNAHVVLEEYVPRAGAAVSSMLVQPVRPVLAVLSAKNAERLREQAAQLVTAIERYPLGDTDLANVAYTLQVGREAMESRLALTAASMAELVSKLKGYLAGEKGIEELYLGEVKQAREALSVLAGEDMAPIVNGWVEKGKYGKLLELWVKGLPFDWQRLYGGVLPRRISLPTYPFAKERCWVEAEATASEITTSVRSDSDDDGAELVVDDEEMSSVVPAPQEANPAEASDLTAEVPDQAAAPDSDTELLRKIQASLLSAVSNLIKVKVEALDPDSELSGYGFDSLSFLMLARELNERYGLDLLPTVFFECPTLAALADFLLANHRGAFAERFAPVGVTAETVAVRPRRTDRAARPRPLAKERDTSLKADVVAVIGMSGRFPMAEDVARFWRNLAEERDCIVEIPKERWDWRAVYGDPYKEANKTDVKWGGFIDGMAEFDPLFFNISPREAELMDPQHRLMLTHAWNAIEDAGYSPKSLSGSRTALLMGTGSSGYGALIARAGDIDGYSMTGLMSSFGPARVSYFLNLHGPSQPIETACSSSLVAVHRAILALSNDSCEMAIAGGVNTVLTAEGHIGLSKAGMLSIDGRCKAFSRHANGYVRAEGVGVVVLKKLSAAERDGDHIYGVIRGSAENHGGRAQSLTAPNPKAQAELLKLVYTRAGIDPRTVSYIETHGTGTPLGDPIEINGLKSAFRELLQEADGGAAATSHAYCGLGSAKSNIGHLEFAAGIAGLIKVLMQLKHKTLIKSLHCEDINPYIQLEDSPFYIVRETQAWRPLQDAQGHDLPRRAGVSSFGFGGVSAHIVIEEYVPRAEASGSSMVVSPARPALVVLSAKNAERLKEQAAQLVAAIEQRPLGDADLADVAYTLQVGREAMESRLALTVASMSELVSKLKRYLAGEKEIEAFYQGETRREKDTLAVFAADDDMARTIEAWVEKGKYGKLLELWVKGLPFDWSHLYGEVPPRRVSLPTYPFARERCWVGPARADAAKIATGQVASIAVDASRQVPPSGDRAQSYEVLTFEEVWEERALPVGSGRKLRKLVCLLSDEQSQRRVTEVIAELAPEAELIFVAQSSASDPEVAEGSQDRSHYNVNRTEGTSYREVMSRIAAAHGEVDAVLYLWALEDASCLRDTVIVKYILQGLASSGLKCGQLLLAGAYGDGLERCHVESWIGFERSLGLVWPQTRVAVIGQERGLPVETWLPRLLGELTAEQFDSAFYRNGQREVCVARPCPLEPSESPLRTNGTYVISGGCGGLGLLVAEHLAKTRTANLVLIGRSELDDGKREAIAALARLGSQVMYLQADVGDRDAITAGLRAAEQRFGALHGLIHAAGITGSVTVFETDDRRFNDVLAPKVTGTLVLDEALGERELDFVCYFSSSAAMLGDFGVCNYATANRFLMAHAHYRNELQSRNERHGKAIVVNWGLWQDGGMGVGGSEQTRMYLKSSGQRALESVEGIALFERLLGQPAAQHLVLVGEPARVQRFVDRIGMKPAPANVAAVVTALPARGQPSGRRAELKGLNLAQCVMWDLKAQVSDLLKLPRERLDDEENLADFGLDSISLAELGRRLARHFEIEVSPSVFFSHPTLTQLTVYFAEVHTEAVEALYNKVEAAVAVGPDVAEDRIKEPNPEQHQRPEQVTHRAPVVAATSAIPDSASGMPEPIAIIGMSGRFPKARSVDELWRILIKGEDAVEEIPPERFDWRRYYGGTQQEAGKTDCKWGGFVPGVGEFDPLFFEISPREAELMDPRQRLLLMEAWKALEDAGFGASQLSRNKIGMFVGVEQGDYQFLNWSSGSITANHDGVLAARLAYVLNMRGPAMAINTACSSGLVALHQACGSLRNGDCDTALAAGVNLLLTPQTFIGPSQAGMLSKDGKCYAFDRRANGMVPAEAVAVVVLKRLSQARADGDPIHAVIRGSGINYDGKTNGITAPSGASQASLLREVYDRCRVNPEQIEHVVAHGTATRLGDPIEVNALVETFKSYTKRQGFCALTSSKTNFGHALAASGLVSLIGLVQSLRHQAIPASLHCEEESDYIDWQASPFYVNKAKRSWPEKPDGQSRFGAVSAFGISGTNAHVVVESYRPPPADTFKAPCYLLVVSAKTEAALRTRVADLIALLEPQDQLAPDPDLWAISHTLLCGRQHFNHRCAIVAEDREAALYALRRIGERERVSNLFQGTVVRNFTGQKAIHGYGNELLTRGDALLSDREQYQETLCALAEFYCQGYDLVWQNLHASIPPRRVPLPTYPFANDRYWVEPMTAPAPTSASANGVGSDILQPSPPRSTETISTAPRTEMAPELHDSLTRWLSELLKLPVGEIDLERDLTEYGMDSISSIQLVNRINQAYQLDLPPTVFVEYPTLADFSEYVGEMRGLAIVEGSDSELGSRKIRDEVVSSAEHATVLHLSSLNGSGERNSSLKSEPRTNLSALGRKARPTPLPLSYAQERLLLVHRRDDVGSCYNLPLAFWLIGDLNIAALQASFTEVVRRHESLRTRFAMVEGKPIQVIEPPLDIEMPIFDLQHLRDSERAEEARHLADDLQGRPFDLEVAPLLRVGLIRTGPTGHLIVIAVHHIVSDGWSQEVMVREISTLYSAFSRGQPSPLPNLPVQYADYAIWQRDQVQRGTLDRELAYWMDRLAGAPDLRLPIDRQRPSKSSYRGATVLFRFPENDVAALRSLAQREGATLFMVLFAAFNVVLSQFSGQKDIVVGTPVAGRRSLELESVIGFLINMVALRTDLSGQLTFCELLKRVKATTSSAFEHQELPLARLEAEIGSMRDLSRQPIFRVLFSLQKLSAETAQFEALERAPFFSPAKTSRRDQSFFMYETVDGLFGIFEYATDLFDASTIEHMISEYRAMLYQLMVDPDCRIATSQLRNPATAPVHFLATGTL